MKQPLTINFAQGLELKTDPKQVPAGKFLRLENTIFNKGGLLQKRNGFGQLTVLPGSKASYLTTFNNNLTAISNTIQAYTEGNKSWTTKGSIQPLSLSTLPLIRSNLNQSQADIAISPGNDLICTVYTDQDISSLSTPVYKYVVADATTGQNVIPSTLIPAPAGGTVTGAPRVFNLDNWFIVVFTSLNSGVYSLWFIAINIITYAVSGPIEITNNYTFSTGLAYDGVVADHNLYVAFNSTSGGQSVKACYINNFLQVSSMLTFAGYTGELMAATTDGTNIEIAFYDGSSNGYVAVFNSALQVVLAPVQAFTGVSALNLAPVLQNNTCTLYYEVDNNYGYDSSIPTHYISSVSVPINTGIPTSPYIVVRSVGLASKGFVINGTQYILGVYSSPYQPTYFLINGSISTEANPTISAKLAYGNGGGYLTTGLPNAIVNGFSVSIPYLFKDLITAVNKTTNPPSGSQVNGIYSQTGINYATFTVGTDNFDTVEIGNSLNLSGGFLSMYDGYLPVEQNFFVWPDSVEGTPNNSGGAMSAQQYFYQVVYQWTDNQGNQHQSAPSIPVEVDMSTANLAFTPPTPITWTGAGAAGQNFIDSSSIAGLQLGQIVVDQTNPSYIQTNSSIILFEPTIPAIEISLPIVTTITADTLATSTICSVTLNIPTLRLTAKVATPVKIAIFRWSAAQQNYFEVTTIEQPILNDTSIDYITFTDTLADSEILGNALIYTTGGVVEDVNAPATSLLTLWLDRLFLVDAEDQNLIWYSKQVIENTPVEMSDLFTIYVAPTIGASGSTGPITALAAMDSNLIIFKKDAIYYISGTGPDNTGANNLFTDPVFITSVVGCVNQQSIIFTPQGLMFQSDKGIWILDRSLSTNYIGSPVEGLVIGNNVVSAQLIPGTNQVRFILDTGLWVVYDYFYQQWSSFAGIPGLSSCIYNNLHTYIDSFGRVFQETPGLYLDADRPTLISFTTSWLNLAGIQGYNRLQEFALVGDYLSPHILEAQIAYDFGSVIQQSTITPQNFAGVYGSDSLYGQSTPYGGGLPPSYPSLGNLENWRVHARHQKCSTFQLTLQEVYNPQYGNLAGGGFTLSALNCVVDAKKGWRPYRGNQSVG